MRIKFLIRYLFIGLTTLAVGCHSNNKGGDKTFGEFPETITLEGRSISMPDTTLRTLGDVSVIDNGYVYFVYNSPNLFSTSDKEFKKFRDFAKKGEGPGEMGSFAAGYPENDNTYRIYEPNAKKIYSISLDSDSDLNLSEIISFPQNFNDYNPLFIRQLSNGNYIGARGDFHYGLICYNPENGEVTEWPLGGDFDNTNPDFEEVSRRVIEFNKEKGILAELYGRYPTLILHNEDGSILRRITYSGYEKHKKADGRVVNCFGNFVLGEKYIWVLYGDQDEMENSRIFCIDYEGNPVAEFIIGSTSTIDVDEKENRILAVDPNSEENNLVIYDIPEKFRRN